MAISAAPVSRTHGADIFTWYQRFHIQISKIVKANLGGQSFQSIYVHGNDHLWISVSKT
jgi:hypothetical protein